MTRTIAKETGERNLCLAGGVALNCVANGKVLRDRQFDEIWIQPAAGDAGGAIGAALYAYHAYRGEGRHPKPGLDAMQGGYLGPQFSLDEIQRRLTKAGAVFETLDDEGLINAGPRESGGEHAQRGMRAGWH